ncbi:MAG: hypothetical protein B6D44_04270 [Ignavibacteriales bacterium UTCHB2]|jgi:hypothetical protein|nr:MAG: hypothetical protein B6D44_04270 [Ignavibacteriales bacterium UTCHB2]
MENSKYYKIILAIIALGIWVLAFQNAGIIPTSQKVKVVNTVDTYVSGGSIDADVSGSVDVDNEVDINISSVNGYNTKSYNGGLLGVACQ